MLPSASTTGLPGSTPSISVTQARRGLFGPRSRDDSALLPLPPYPFHTSGFAPHPAITSKSKQSANHLFIFCAPNTETRHRLRAD